MSKHTQGPWKLLKFEDDERYEVSTANSTKDFYRSVATISFGYSEPAETEQHANAKLIAAAPELLEALRLTVAALEGKPCRQQALDDAMRAILKATT